MSRRHFIPRAWDYRSTENSATNGFLSPGQIVNHSFTRLRCSLTAGVDIALMKSQKMIGKYSAVSHLAFRPTGARVQDDSGEKAFPAAHALPSGIAVGNLPIHQLASTTSMQNFLAEPYRFTNIVPLALNRADSRAEGFNRKNGPTLVRSFVDFCQRVMLAVDTQKGKVDRSEMRSAYVDLTKNYAESFKFALENRPLEETGRVKVIPGMGQLVDPAIPYTSSEFLEDCIRASLRTQYESLREGGVGYSPLLVDEVESDFHEAVSATATISTADGASGDGGGGDTGS